MKLVYIASRAALAGGALIICGAAVAQSIPPVSPTAGESIFAIIRDSATATFLAILSALAIWARGYLPQWFVGVIDMNKSRSADSRENFKRKVAEDAITHAMIKTGLTPDAIKTLEEKDGFIGWAMSWIAVHANDLLAAADKDGNKVPDFIDVQLRKLAPNLPVTPAPAAATPTPAEVMGFMQGPTAPVRRGVTKSASQMAATLAPRRSKGALQ